MGGETGRSALGDQQGEERQPRSQDLGGGCRDRQGSPTRGRKPSHPSAPLAVTQGAHTVQAGSLLNCPSHVTGGAGPSSSGACTPPVDSPPPGRRAPTWALRWRSPTLTALCGHPFHSTLTANPQSLPCKHIHIFMYIYTYLFNRHNSSLL